jgi:endo-1,4-beta-xylanase
MKNKKTMAIILIFAFMFAQILGISVLAQKGLVYEAPQGTPAIDGEIDAVWDTAEWTETSIYNQNYEPLDGVSLRQKILWDTDYVYFLFELTCPSFNEEVDPTAGGAEVEIFLDELLCREEGTRSICDRQTLVSFMGGIGEWGVTYVDNGDLSNGRVDLTTAKSKKTSTGVILEVAMKFNSIKGEVGKELGLEFMLDYKNADSTETTVIRWNCEPDEDGSAPWQGTEFWGTLKLVAAPVPEVPEIEPEVVAPEEPAAAPETAPETPAAPVVPESPKVGDNGLIYIILISVTAAGIFLVLRKRNVNVF